MPSIFDEPKRDSFKEFLREQAKNAMNDKEVGLIGQSEAMADYERLSEELDY